MSFSWERRKETIAMEEETDDRMIKWREETKNLHPPRPDFGCETMPISFVTKRPLTLDPLPSQSPIEGCQAIIKSGERKYETCGKTLPCLVHERKKNYSFADEGEKRCPTILKSGKHKGEMCGQRLPCNRHGVHEFVNFAPD